jgi:hypothetical protein
MKFFFILSLLNTLLLSSGDCSNKSKTTESNKYKGKLEIAGICMNYTIHVVEGNIDTSLIETNWTDEVSMKAYNNVFRLGNPCQFPPTIKQGDEFYFKIDSSETKPCTVCMAYYPTPNKAVSIKVLSN